MHLRKIYKPLLIFHVLLFITPIVVKGLHSHENTECNSVHEGINQAEPDGHCYVCNYEFVIYNSAVKANYSIYQPLSGFLGCTTYINTYKSTFHGFTHRGPPAC